MVTPILQKLLTYFSDLGVRPGYRTWEIYLTRKINLSSILGFFNVSIALTVFHFIGYHNSLPEGLIVLLLTPVLLFINFKWGYIPAAYMFTFIGCFLFYFLSVKMGVESFSFTYYFTMAAAIIQMMPRRELFQHLALMLLMCLASFSLVIISYYYNFFEVQLSKDALHSVRYLNIFFAFATSLAFMCIISYQAMQQENQLQSALTQKEILLAELFHRVKNNLNIVTSLLNLKKGSVNSEEAQNALEECRNLIFSMSLVHNKTYNSNKIDSLNLREYLEELGKELVYTLGGKDDVEFQLSGRDSYQNISNAIPCGLIFNELITNSFKHAKGLVSVLKIDVELIQDEKEITLIYTDNGRGFSPNYVLKKNTLGLELIKSLCEQINAKYTIDGEARFRFSMTFSS
jgi:two-component sensor histidine kinase